MIGLLTGLTGFILTFSGASPDVVQFKEVEQEVVYYLGSEYKEGKCSIPLSSIAYGFASKETGNGKGLKQKNKNNLFGLRYGSDKDWVNFRVYDHKSFTKNGYNVYQSRRDAIFDFMLMFYRDGCSFTVKYAARYKNGSKGGMGGAETYHKQVLSYARSYDKKGIYPIINLTGQDNRY